ncbi:unnamed protein product [Closterium sp. NIES-64]|nr:unnamed protein product [Closterium sp. NIES-64]
MMTPPSNGGVPSPLHPASVEDAPLRSAPDAPLRHGHSRPAAHVAHGRSHLSAQGTDGVTRRAGAGAQEIVPHDEGSKVAAASAAAVNAGRGSDDARRDDQENAGMTIDEQGIGDDAFGDLGTSFATPRGVAIATGGATAAGEACNLSRRSSRRLARPSWCVTDERRRGDRPRGATASSAERTPGPSRASSFRGEVRTSSSRGRKRTGSRIALRGTFVDRSGGQIHQVDRRMPHEAQTNDFPR